MQFGEQVAPRDPRVASRDPIEKLGDQVAWEIPEKTEHGKGNHRI
jgi:hypothetical protein